jgi:hypothetical protein
MIRSVTGQTKRSFFATFIIEVHRQNIIITPRFSTKNRISHLLMSSTKIFPTQFNAQFDTILNIHIQ